MSQKHIKEFKATITGVRPVSFNKAYYNHRRVLTREAREYRTEFLHQLNKGKIGALKAFNTMFNPSEHYMVLKFDVEVPEDIFWTKDGNISMRSGDVDNYLKLIIDFTCNDKYYDDDTRLLGPCFNLGVDDRFITDLSVKKRPAKAWSIKISAKIYNLSEIK